MIGMFALEECGDALRAVRWLTTCGPRSSSLKTKHLGDVELCLLNVTCTPKCMPLANDVVSLWLVGA